MESSFEWYQIIIVYGIGFVLAFYFYALSKECHKTLGINHYILTIMYVASGFIGMKIFGVENQNNKQVQESIWESIWNLFVSAPLDLGVNIIVMMVIFSFFSMVPFMGMMFIIILYKRWKSPDSFYQK